MSHEFPDGMLDDETARPRGVVTRKFTEETGVAIDENEHIQMALMTNPAKPEDNKAS